MKKIAISLGIIGVVAAIVIGATTAYFSDTETSTGNTFTAGSIDLKIDNTCSLNGEPVQDCTWGLTDLDGELFFNFSDLKPGDWGEDTVSVHVDNNPAWACVTFNNLVSDDEDCTEPELEDEELCGEDEKGELAENLEFRFWADMCYIGEVAEPGDNKFTVGECEEGDDVYLMSGNASDLGTGPVTYALADSDENNVGGQGPLVGSETYYIGKVWCFGDLDYTVGEDDAKVWTCDGESVDNASQSDSLTGDIEFTAIQARNNDSFQCGQPE